jgi:integrase
MGRRANTTTVEVIEGVYLKPVQGVDHCYFRIGDKQFRKSTRTIDIAKAKLLALEWHRDAENKRDRGEEIERISFARLKRTYLDHIKQQDKHRYHKETIERHFLPFFAKFDDISKIRSAPVLDYLAFRNAQGAKPPLPQTLNRENLVLRQMMRFAVDRDWIKQAPAIRHHSERNTTRRRRHFTIEEYRTLWRTGRKRARGLSGIPLKTRQHWQRQLLYDYMLVLSNTGMRIDESKTIIWRNVDLDNARLLLEGAGKTRSSRRIVIQGTSAIDALQRIKKRRLDYLARSGVGDLDPNEKVIALSDGKPVKKFKKGFDQLLQACGFQYASSKDRHSLTSLRHTYATFRLTTRSGKRATTRALAKQMGTSQRMIEKHYGHDEIEDYRDELSG